MFSLFRKLFRWTDEQEPRWFRETCDGRIFSWEIYDRHSFYITISFENTEIQINKWPSDYGYKKEK